VTRPKISSSSVSGLQALAFCDVDDNSLEYLQIPGFVVYPVSAFSDPSHVLSSGFNAIGYQKRALILEASLDALPERFAIFLEDDVRP